MNTGLMLTVGTLRVDLPPGSQLLPVDGFEGTTTRCDVALLDGIARFSVERIDELWPAQESLRVFNEYLTLIREQRGIDSDPQFVKFPTKCSESFGAVVHDADDSATAIIVMVNHCGGPMAVVVQGVVPDRQVESFIAAMSEAEPAID